MIVHKYKRAQIITVNSRYYQKLHNFRRYLLHLVFEETLH